MNQDKIRTTMQLIDLCCDQMESIRGSWMASLPSNNKIYIEVLIDDLNRLARICDAEQKILEETK